MFEQDYIMRLIREMVRALLKLMFHIDTQTPTAEMFEDVEMKKTAEHLQRLVDDGKINEAEQKLFDMVDRNSRNILGVALVFYSYLNDKDDGWLMENGFSREEIKQGIEDIVSAYGIDGFGEIFLEDE